MLDARMVLKERERIVENIKNRSSRVDFNEFIVQEENRRALEPVAQQLRQRINAISRDSTLSIDGRREAVATLKKELSKTDEELRLATAASQSILLQMPNLTHPDTPIGEESASKVLGYGKTPKPDPLEQSHDHLQIGERLEIVDTERAARVAGAGFYFLRGKGALLELALIRFAIDKAVKRGFELLMTPDVARDDIMQGTGYVPRGDETNTYHLEGTDLSLIATSEIPLCGAYKDEVFEEKAIPKRLCGFSHCFRTERAHGRATRGIYRVHQFSKVELVIISHPESSEHFHQELLDIEREIFDGLGLHYRVLDIASRDLGASAYRKFDIEAWMPSRARDGGYGEVTSTSNCTDYQARRLNMRFKNAVSGRNELVHTLNGTAIAVPRAIVSILESNLRPDGHVRMPEALVPYLGFDHI